MTIRLVCGDGNGVRVSKEYFEKSVFNNPDIARARSYTLKCKASLQIVSALLDLVEGLRDKVTITEANFEELQNMCRELGFTGLDKELHAFRGKTWNDSVDAREVLQLKERVMRHNKLLSEIQRQLSEVLRWQRKTETEMQESVSRQFQCLERKVNDLECAYVKIPEEASRKMERALMDFAKRSDLDELARDLKQLKRSERTAQVAPVKSAVKVIEPKRSALPPLKPAEPAPPVLNKRREFVYNESEKLDGVIAQLTRECGGNVHNKGIVNVTASSVANESNHPKNATEFETKQDFYSQNEPNSWICYDFKERRVIPTSYSARSSYGGPGGDNLKSWVIEVSNDRALWTEIDCRNNNNDLNGYYVTARFKISWIPRESFRFFRLRQTGKNHRGNDRLELSSLEIFGTLFEK